MHGIPEGGWSGLKFRLGICGRSLIPRLRNSTQIRLGTRQSWLERSGARTRVQSLSAVTPTPLGSYPDDEIRSGSASLALPDPRRQPVIAYSMNTRRERVRVRVSRVFIL